MKVARCAPLYDRWQAEPSRSAGVHFPGTMEWLNGGEKHDARGDDYRDGIRLALSSVRHALGHAADHPTATRAPIRARPSPRGPLRAPDATHRYAAIRASLDSLRDSQTQSCTMAVAGWSSLVARRAHNPKVVGSNPAPATKYEKGHSIEWPFFVSTRYGSPSLAAPSAGSPAGATCCPRSFGLLLINQYVTNAKRPLCTAATIFCASLLTFVTFCKIPISAKRSNDLRDS